MTTPASKTATGRQASWRAPVLAALWTALALSMAQPAAGDTDAQSGETRRIETLQVTASAHEQSVLESAAAITVVPDELLRQQRTTVLPEALRGEVGTWFQQTTPGQGTPILRGLKGSQVLNLVDGMRLNNAFFRSAPSQYLALVDSLNVRNLEVVRGPSSTLYGNDAMGGVVNVITPTPGHAPRWTLRPRAHAEAGSAEQLRVLHGDLQASGPTLALLGSLTWQQAGDRRTGSGQRLHPSAWDSRSAGGKLLYTPASGHHELVLSGQFTRQDSTPRVDEMIPGYGQDDPSSAEFFFEPNSRGFAHAIYTWTPGQGMMDHLQIDLARQVIRDDRRDRDTGSMRRTLEHNESTLDGLKVQAEFLPGQHSFFTLGLELYQDTVHSRRESLGLDSGLSEAREPRFPDGATMDSSALFAYMETRPLDDWTASGGLRYSRFTIQAPGDDVSGYRLSPDDLTGNLGLGYEAAPGLRLSANLGRGFRPPNISDLGALGPRPGNRYNLVNPQLQPESVLTLDLGAKYVAGPWEAEIYAWRSRYRDQIAPVPTGEFTEDGRQVVRSENLNRVHLHGLESGLRYHGAWGGKVYGVLNWTRGQEYSADGQSQPADRIPPLSGQLGLDWPLGPALAAQAWVHFAGGQDRLSNRDAGDPRIDPAGTAGWSTANLALRWHTAGGLEVGLRLENLLDRSYREHGSGVDAPGRNLVLSVSAGY